MLHNLTNDTVKIKNDRAIWVINENFKKIGKNPYNYKHATALELKQLYPDKFNEYTTFTIIKKYI